MSPRSTSPPAAYSAFVEALAKRINVAAVAYLPRPAPGETPDSTRARLLWTSRADAEQPAQDRWRERAERHARARLTDAGAPDDPAVAVAAVRTPNAQVVGMLVALKDGRHTWSASQRALTTFVAEYYAQVIDERAAGDPASDSSETSAATDPASADLATGMQSAADRGELHLVYQPEVDLATRRVVSVEALLRWTHPERGELSPAEFVHVAERSALIEVLGDWVIGQALRDLASWRRRAPAADPAVRLNVSPAQFNRSDFVERLRDQLRLFGVPGDRVCLEITENVPMSDAAELVRILRQLREFGVTSAIDDLTTGYSTLSRWRVVPVDVVKLDRSMVTGLDHDDRGRLIVGALIRLARELRTEVVAEGVETDEEARTLRELGCGRAQGHLFGRPMAADEVADLFASSSA